MLLSKDTMMYVIAAVVDAMCTIRLLFANTAFSVASHIHMTMK